MTARLAIVLSLLLAATNGFAQEVRPSVYVQPSEDGMHTYVTAAFFKKKTPVNVVTDPALATHTLTLAPIEQETVSTGKRVVNCLFVYCAGNENKASTSVTPTNTNGVVEWSYAVNKGRGSKNLQSMAEAIAKHLGNHLKQLARERKR